MASDLKKEIEKLVNKVVGQGWTADNKHRHWKLVNPAGQQVYLAKTPSEYRAVANAKSLLRRYGADV